MRARAALAAALLAGSLAAGCGDDGEDDIPEGGGGPDRGSGIAPEKPEPGGQVGPDAEEPSDRPPDEP